MVYQASLGIEAVREKRNRLLAESDWTQAADAPLSPGMVAAWAEYRRELRDLTGGAIPVVFPAAPTQPVIFDAPSEAFKDQMLPGEDPSLAAERLWNERDEIVGWITDGTATEANHDRRLELDNLLIEIRSHYDTRDL